MFITRLNNLIRLLLLMISSPIYWYNSLPFIVTYSAYSLLVIHNQSTTIGNVISLLPTSNASYHLYLPLPGNVLSVCR